MNELLGVLCVLSILLAVVTVVGHCIWLMFAALFKAVTAEGGANSQGPRACGACGHPQGVAGGRCRFCGAPAGATAGLAAGATATVKGDLYATARQLDRLHERGAIDAAQHQNLLQLLREEHARLMGQPSPFAPSPRAAAPLLPPPVTKPEPARAGETALAGDDSPIVAVEVVAEEAGIYFPPAVPPRVPVAPSVAVASAAAHVAAPPPAAAPVEPLRPGRTLADVLQSFMQEKNIRWGELISGMLIVGCAVGLVISFRTTLQETVPYFPGFLFMLVTAAIHGAGNYTLRRWNLASTSRGVLIIGTLLVPLNFLAAIILSGPQEKQIPATDPVFISAVLIGLVAYGAMTYFASRALQREGWWWLLLAVMGPSAGQILINRLAGPDLSAWQVTAVMGLPLASFLIAVLAQIAQSRRSRELSPRRAEQVFLLLGAAVFSLLAPLALLVSKVHVPGQSWLATLGETLAQLSPALSLAAAVVLGAGLIVQNRSLRARATAYRVTGTALAIGGAVLMVVMVALAWPRPEMLIAVGLVNAIALVTLAVVCEMPVLHGAAAACAALAYLVGFHLWQGTFEGFSDALGLRLVQILVLGKSCVAMTFFAAALAGIGAALTARKRPAEGLQYELAAGATAVLCIATTLIVAFWPQADWVGREMSLATPLLFVYALGLLGTGLLSRHPLATWGGSLLLWAGLVHTLHGNVWMHDLLVNLDAVPDRPVLDATLAHAAILMAFALVAAWLKSQDAQVWEGLVVPLCLSALLSSVAATPFVFVVKGEDYSLAAAQATIVSAVWLSAAWLLRVPALATAFQALAVAALELAVLAVGRAGGWWDGTLFDLQFLPVHFVVLAAWCCLWSGARQALGKESRLAELFATPWPAVDQGVLAVLVRAIVVLAALGCWPGIVAELGMTSQVSEWTGRRAHELAYSTPVWIALGAAYCALFAALWERLSRRGLAGLFVAGAAIPFLLAGPFESQHAVASALRWSFAIYGAVAAAAICSRGDFSALARRLNWRGAARFLPSDPPRLRILGLVLGGLPVLLLTGWTLARVAAGEPLGGPDAASIFGHLGPSISFAVPLLICTGILLAYALREASSGYALGGSVLFQATVTLGYVLRAILAQETPDARFVVELFQWNALGLVGYSLLWLALQRFIERGVSERPAREAPLGEVWGALQFVPLKLQLWTLLAALAALSLWAALAVVILPHVASPAAEQLGAWPSYVAWAGGWAALVWMRRRELDRLGIHFVLGGVVGVLALVAATLHGLDTQLTWLALHALGSSWLVVAAAATTALVVLRLRQAEQRWLGSYQGDLAAWATVLGVVLVGLATRGLWGDPLEWWSALLVGSTAGIALALSLAGRSQPYALAATVCSALTATYLWLGLWTGGVPDLPDVVSFALWNLLAVLVPAGVVLAAEIWCQRRYQSPLDVRFGVVAVHHGVAIGALALLGALVAGGLGLTSLVRAATGSEPYDSSTVESLLVLAGLGTLLIATLWDRSARYVVPGLYAWGLLAVAFLLDQWEDAPLLGPLVVRPELRPAFTLLAVGLAAGMYVAVTGRLWHAGLHLARWESRAGIPQTVAGLARIANWLPTANLVLSGAAVVIEFGVVLSFQERWMRILAGFAPAAAAIGIASLAQERRRSAMQIVSLLLAGGAGVLLGWADMQPGWSDGIVLERSIRLLMALALLTFLLGTVVVRLATASDSWKLAARRTAGIYGAASLAALLLVLGLEATFFVPGVGAPLVLSQVLAVAVVLVGLIVGLLSLALLPGHDPLTLGEEGRMFYVYGAQAVGALLFAHLYLANPVLFDAGLRAYWPYIVVGVSFFGVGAGELFRRARLRVLAEPFQRTGAFLPLLPVIGIWIVAAEHTNYSALLFIVGLLYALLAMLRKSTVSGIAAAVAGNAALWALLSEREFSILANPQIWAIPPALSVLAAAQLNRRRLGDEGLTSVRYAAMLVIYASSTAEIFIRGADASLWPPMILAVLSVAGVLSGIGLKIRAFLYLGASFLLLSILSMVWNAARNIGHIWPWFVFGIGLGIAILVLFGMFEKKRKEITLAIERMRQWER